MISKEDLSYVAGLIDGEGHITLGYYKKIHAFCLIVAITNTNLEVLNWVQNLFGGKIIHLKHKRSNWKECYRWRLYSQQTLPFLRKMKPLL